MNPGCCFKSVIFIWSVEQGWPQPDSSQTKIISYIPFPQVCPVGLDTENEVNQVKDVVMLLGLIRLSQSAGQSDHRHSPQGDSGEHLPPPPSGLRREISRDILLLRLEWRPACCLLFCLRVHLNSRNSLEPGQLSSFLHEQTWRTATPLRLVTISNMVMWLRWNSGQDIICHKYGL